MTESGIRAVYLQERTKLVRLLTARLGDAAEAEDVLQELWLKIQQAAPGPIASPAAYLMRMANNLAIDRKRTETWRSLREADWVDTQPSAAEHPDATDVLLSRERLAHVEAAIAALPDRVGRVFRMYRLEGMAQKQIARDLGVSLSLVEKLLHQAYRAIHDAGREDFAGASNRLRLSSQEDRA